MHNEQVEVWNQKATLVFSLERSERERETVTQRKNLRFRGFLSLFVLSEKKKKIKRESFDLKARKSKQSSESAHIYLVCFAQVFLSLLNFLCGCVVLCESESERGF